MKKLLLLLVALPGCGGSVADDVHVAQRDVGATIWWLGESFEGLELTHVESSGRGALLVYGTCEPLSDGGCTPPLQLQNVKCPGRPTAVAIFPGGELGRRAAEALEPVGPSASAPEVSLDVNRFGACFEPR